MEQLAQGINREIGVGERDERGFSTHITVARVKTALGKEEIARVLKDFSNYDFGEAIASEVKIKESKLSAGGPSYSDLYKVTLQ